MSWKKDQSALREIWQTISWPMPNGIFSYWASLCGKQQQQQHGSEQPRKGKNPAYGSCRVQHQSGKRGRCSWSLFLSLFFLFMMNQTYGLPTPPQSAQTLGASEVDTLRRKVREAAGFYTMDNNASRSAGVSAAEGAGVSSDSFYPGLQSTVASSAMGTAASYPAIGGRLPFMQGGSSVHPPYGFVQQQPYYQPSMLGHDPSMMTMIMGAGAGTVNPYSYQQQQHPGTVYRSNYPSPMSGMMAAPYQGYSYPSLFSHLGMVHDPFLGGGTDAHMMARYYRPDPYYYASQASVYQPYPWSIGYGLSNGYNMPMPIYDAYGSSRRHFPARNHVSSVKDLWQSNFM